MKIVYLSTVYLPIIYDRTLCLSLVDFDDITVAEGISVLTEVFALHFVEFSAIRSHRMMT